MSNSTHHQAAPLTVVAGLGVTGVSVIRHLLGQGHRLRVVDSRYAPPGLAELADIGGEVEVHTGSLGPELLAGASLLVLSPGLPLDIPLVASAERQGVAVVGDIELFAQAVACPVIAVTGSNGKSTVTALAAKLARSAGIAAEAGGNLGPAALDLLTEENLELAVLELSSFQLETTQNQKPAAAALLNVSADHLDRHGSIEEYAAVKGQLLDWADVAVVNRDDEQVSKLAANHGNCLTFGLTPPLAATDFGILTRGGATFLAVGDEPLLATASLSLTGAHNWANALAALALVSAAGVDPRLVLDTLATFPGLPHRCQWLAEIDGVTYINDSKATNPGSTVAALQGLNGPIILIAGGQSKAADLRPLANAVVGRVREAWVFGEDGGKLQSAIASSCPVHLAADMESALLGAAAIAEPGDTVMLSPACASLDMFSSYVERGERFAALVAGLAA